MLELYKYKGIIMTRVNLLVFFTSIVVSSLAFANSYSYGTPSNQRIIYPQDYGTLNNPPPQKTTDNNNSTAEHRYGEKHWSFNESYKDTVLYSGISLSSIMNISTGLESNNIDLTYLRPNTINVLEREPMITPVTLYFGGELTPLYRADISFVTVSGIYHKNDILSQDGDATFPIEAFGGELDSNILLANLYYDLSYSWGKIGAFAPYIGAGLGFARNEISEIKYLDEIGWNNITIEAGAIDQTGAHNIIDFHTIYGGDSNINLAYMGEFGLRTNINDRVELSFFMKYSYLGMAQTSGYATTIQTDIGGPGTLNPILDNGKWYQDAGATIICDTVTGASQDGKPNGNEICYVFDIANSNISTVVGGNKLLESDRKMSEIGIRIIYKF